MAKKMYIMRWKIKIKTAKKKLLPITFLIFQPPRNFFFCALLLYIHTITQDSSQWVSYLKKIITQKIIVIDFFPLIFWLFLMNISFSTHEYPQAAAIFSTILEYVLLSPLRTVRMLKCFNIFFKDLLAKFLSLLCYKLLLLINFRVIF